MTANYDERGNQVKEASCGLRDDPAIDQSNGAHAVEQSYDERGNCIAREYYGADGQRCLTKGGYAKMRANYDDRGRRFEQAVLDLTGKSTVIEDGRDRAAEVESCLHGMAN